jgi:hypothetical protein
VLRKDKVAAAHSLIVRGWRSALYQHVATRVFSTSCISAILSLTSNEIADVELLLMLKTGFRTGPLSLIHPKVKY